MPRGECFGGLFDTPEWTAKVRVSPFDCYRLEQRRVLSA